MSVRGDRQWRYWAAAAVTVLAVFAIGLTAFVISYLGAWDHDEPGTLKPLQQDPMSFFVPTGAKLVDRYEDAPGYGYTGAPSIGMVSRTFVLPRTRATAALDEARTAARRAGWALVRRSDLTFDKPGPLIDFFAADRAPLHPKLGRTDLSVSLKTDTYDDPFPPGTVGLTIRVSARPAR